MAAADVLRKYGRGFVRGAGRVLEVAFGTGADQVAAGNHDHSTTGVGAAGATTAYRGGASMPPTTVTTTPYTVQPGDYIIHWKVSGAATINLPSPTSGRALLIIDFQRDGAAKTLARGSATINGAAADGAMPTSGASRRRSLHADGSDWDMA